MFANKLNLLIFVAKFINKKLVLLVMNKTSVRKVF